MKCVPDLPLKLPQLTPQTKGTLSYLFQVLFEVFRGASMSCIHDESLSKHFLWTSRFSWRILGWSSHLVGVQGFFPIHGPSTGTIKTLVFFFVHLPAMCFVHMKHFYKSFNKKNGKFWRAASEKNNGGVANWWNKLPFLIEAYDPPPRQKKLNPLKD